MKRLMAAIMIALPMFCSQIAVAKDIAIHAGTLIDGVLSPRDWTACACRVLGSPSAIFWI
jgi:hypothetical protein